MEQTNFTLWKQLGRQIFIKSSINNWLVCHPVTGTLLDLQKGNVNCTVTKYVHYVADPSKSSSETSKFLPSTNYGPMFYSSGRWSSAFNYFNSYTGKNWLTHDPCGTNRPNQKKKMFLIHTVTFWLEPSSKDRQWQTFTNVLSRAS